MFGFRDRRDIDGFSKIAVTVNFITDKALTIYLRNRDTEEKEIICEIGIDESFFLAHLIIGQYSDLIRHKQYQLEDELEAKKK